MPGFWYNPHASVGPCNKTMNVTLVESSVHSLFSVVRASGAWWSHLKSMRIQITGAHGRVDATPGFWYTSHASVNPCYQLMHVTLVESSVHSLFNVVRASAAWWSHRTFVYCRDFPLTLTDSGTKNQSNANLVSRRVEHKQQVCWVDCNWNDRWLWKQEGRYSKWLMRLLFSGRPLFV